jgi:hypothetical protein
LTGQEFDDMKHLRFTGLALAALVLGLALGGRPAQADSITLQDLLDGDEFVVGDKLFTNFAYGPTLISGDPVIPDASQIIVQGSVSGDDVTISFLGFWESVYPEISISELSYDVYVTDPSYLVAAVSVDAIGGASVTGGGRVRIDGTISALDNTFLGDLTVATSINQLSDTQSISPQSAIRVSNGITVFAGRTPTNSTAGLNFFSQTFTQTLIPEPSSVVLMGLGVGFAGVVAVRRRRRDG